MITFRVSTDVKADRQDVLTLPGEAPIGQTGLVVMVAGPIRQDEKPPRTSLADWAEDNAEHWGTQLSSEDVAGFTGRRL